MKVRPERLPFFVYGTLRPGEPNHRRYLEDRTEAEEPARMHGLALYEGPGYPYAVPAGPGSEVLGDLVLPAADHYPELLRTLDRLEDYAPGDPDNVYERVALEARRVRTGAAVLAWVYVAAEPLAARLLAAAEPVAGGEWRGGAPG